jgi:hypothetical protein
LRAGADVLFIAPDVICAGTGMAADFPSEIVVRDYGSLVDALRIARESREISFSLLDHLAGLCAGHSEKLLGVGQQKRIGPLVLGLLLEALGVELIMRESPAAARMAHRWDKIDAKQVRVSSQRLLPQATLNRLAPQIMSELARKGWRTRRARNGHASGHSAK